MSEKSYEIWSLWQPKWQIIEQYYKIIYENVESDAKVSFTKVFQMILKLDCWCEGFCQSRVNMKTGVILFLSKLSNYENGWNSILRTADAFSHVKSVRQCDRNCRMLRWYVRDSSQRYGVRLANITMENGRDVNSRKLFTCQQQRNLFTISG